MSNKDLFKEAIADAKAVREAALANAKVALEEALAPKLQSMLAAKLQEMESEDLDEAEDKEELDEMELGQDNYATDDIQRVNARKLNASLEEGEEDLEEDFDLSSILAELSEADKDEELDEAKKEDKEDLDEAEEGEEEEEEEEEEGADEAPESDESDKITDLTVDELKDIIKDIISTEMGGDETPEMGDMGADMGDLGDGDEMPVDVDGVEGEEVSDEIEEDFDLEELLAELDALDEGDDDKDDMYEAKKKEDKKKKDEKDEMKEAIDTIEALRNELNEVNLLNAKLLYVNKVFKAKNLNESQKLKVIAQFDKANTAKEAKAIFESMSSAIAKSKKSTIKESLGFASKAAGVAPKKQIVEVNETVSRWQMLAGINKF
jgi:hypothetical protein